MELFIWLWAFDKRVMCGAVYTSTSFAYIWLIPAVMAACVLGITWYLKASTDDSPTNECLKTDATTRKDAHLLQKMMLIQESILILVFFSALLCYIVTDRIVKAYHRARESQMQPTLIKKTGEIIQRGPLSEKNTSYDF